MIWSGGFRRRLAGVVLVAMGLALNATAVRGSIHEPIAQAGALDVYTLTTDAQGFFELAAGGFDIVGAVKTDGGERFVTLVLTTAERERLVQRGMLPVLARTASGMSYSQSADSVLQAGGYEVYKPYDGEDGIEAEVRALAAAHPNHVRLIEIGRTLEDRPILALRVTGNIADIEEGERPATWFNALQHAREWIAIEVNRRLARHFIEGYGEDAEITAILDGAEMWFVVCANPDGYQQTFREGGRMWRKNMRDNDGDGEFNPSVDGVDPNRNFPGHWGYDNQGSFPSFGSGTYRGSGPASEPMTQAQVSLMERLPFKFLINYHSAAELILYPEGWQDKTFSADHAIFTALAGSPGSPAIAGFEPMLSSGLYITNGETCDYAHAEHGILCYTPELSRPPGGGGTFDFPDDEALIQAEFELNLPFAMDIARSTVDPAEPVSHLGNSVEPIYVDEFPVSYGDPQPVQANLLRKLGDAEMVYRIGDGEPVREPTEEWEGGERYGASGDVYYRRVRGMVSGAEPGDVVEVWFEAGGSTSEPFTYTLASDSDAPVLVLAQEDYTGVAPVYERTDGPTYLDYYADLLRVHEVGFDVYDFDARERRAPSPLGVLSHYDLVIWYTGDDTALMAEERASNQVDAAALDIVLAVRDYLNEGGKLWWTGKAVGMPYWQGRSYDPNGDMTCGEEGVFCEGLQNDFLQYYLGAFSASSGPALNAETRFIGAAAPFEGVDLGFGPPGADNQTSSLAFSVTSDSMPADEFPQFDSHSAGTLDHPGRHPHSGDSVLYSGETFYAWQQLARTIDLADAESARLDFWTVRSTRDPFDALFVEARPVISGTDPVSSTWTTLPDANGHTSQSAALSCRSTSWFGLAERFKNYMTRNAAEECEPTGTTGEWHAATGSSSGWENWSIDLSAYAGQTVEVSVSYFSSRVAVTGVYLDDVSVTMDDAVVAETSFEDGDMGGWESTGLEVNGEPHSADWVIAGDDAFPATQPPIVVTEDTILFGFGFEGIASPDGRADVLRRVLEYFGIEASDPEPPDPRLPTIHLPLAMRGPAGG